MSAKPDPIRKAELHAYVDGQLDETRRREVEEFIASDSEAARRVAAYGRQRDALKKVLDPVLSENIPPIFDPPASSGRRRLHLVWAAAAVLLFAIGGVIGWQMRGMSVGAGLAERAVAEQAAIAHAVFTPQRRHPVEVEANEEAHLVRWLSKVLGANLRAPRLVDLGFSLVGGRLLSAPNGPAAQFMYQDADKKRLTLYVVNDPDWRGTAEFHFARQRDISVFYWIDGSLGYAITAEMPRAELFKIVQEVHRQLEQ